MRVDLKAEFEYFDSIEFDGYPTQKQEYVFQKIVEASSSVVHECLRWLDENHPDALSEGQFEDYLELELATKLVDRARGRALSEVFKNMLLKTI